MAGEAAATSLQEKDSRQSTCRHSGANGSGFSKLLDVRAAQRRSGFFISFNSE